MSCDFIELANSRVRELTPYQPGKPIDELKRELGIDNVIKLASNENPLGPSKKALEALQQVLSETHRYPDGSAYSLKQALATHLQVSTDRITLGNGSDNLLAMIVQTFVEPEAEIIIPQYGFSTFSIIAKANHAKPIIAASKNWGTDLSTIKNAITDKTQLIFIANPNNPTGTWCKKDEFIAFMSSISQDILVVMDEAYFEYANEPTYPNTIPLQQQFSNIITTRTFSKIYGLAGLRVGYAISHPDIANLLNRVRLPFNVSHIAQVAAIAALDDQQYIETGIKLNLQGQQQFAERLKKLNLNYIPSITNFVTIDMGTDAQAIFEKLLRRGIIVRPLKPYEMPNHLRVSIGLPQENQRFFDTLEEILHE